MPLCILVSVRYDNLSAIFCYIAMLASVSRLTKRAAPSFATKYRPKNPVHPNTVATCPVMAERPGGPWEMIGLLRTVSRSAYALCE